MGFNRDWEKCRKCLLSPNEIVCITKEEDCLIANAKQPAVATLLHSISVLNFVKRKFKGSRDKTIKTVHTSHTLQNIVLNFDTK